MVSTFGVVFDTKLQKFDWSQFRAFARLDKKTDESLEKYYYSFIAMCKRVCRMQAKAETGKQGIAKRCARSHQAPSCQVPWSLRQSSCSPSHGCNHLGHMWSRPDVRHDIQNFLLLR